MNKIITFATIGITCVIVFLSFLLISAKEELALCKAENNALILSNEILKSEINKQNKILMEEQIKSKKIHADFDALRKSIEAAEYKEETIDAEEVTATEAMTWLKEKAQQF